ncbi:MAG: tyrosine-type recombinase/integrase, partial [Candidatus Cybelea sp.]
LRQRKKEAMREGLGDCRLVFPTESGRISKENKYGPILSKSNFLKKTWEPLRKAAKITAKFHTLRHTCAVQLLRANVNPKAVQQRLGHASITLTMDTYAAWVPSLQAKAAEAMGDMFTRLAPKRRQKARAS